MAKRRKGKTMTRAQHRAQKALAQIKAKVADSNSRALVAVKAASNVIPWAKTIESPPMQKSVWPRDNVKGESLRDLLRMLSTRRPYKSATCDKFCADWLEPLGARRDIAGNWILRIGDAPVLWSSHTDTVHGKEGEQRLSFQNDFLRVARKSQADSSCLGADCTAGVWIMREMIHNGCQGLYIFHAGEEQGGIGSTYIATKTPELLTGIQAAIAFDRRGTRSVITNQGWSRTCSDAFGESLAKALGMGHVLDNGGTYTDTKEYIGLVPECSNLSVGYMGEHTKNESLDVPYLFALRDAMIEFDSAALTIERTPEIEDYEFGGGYASRYASAYSYYGTATASNRTRLAYDSNLGEDYMSQHYSRADAETDAMAKLVRDNPDLIVELLEDYGVTLSEAADFIFENRGIIPSELHGLIGESQIEAAEDEEGFRLDNE